MLDNVLNKLGLYDLMGVFYTGVIISVISWLVNNIFELVSLQIEGFAVNATFLFIVISYFLGLVFQEIGSFLSKVVFFRENKLLLGVLNSKENTSHSMSKAEIKLLKKKIKEECNLTNDDLDISYIYNHCRYYCMEHCDMTKIDKDQSIAAMGRSLSIFFLILSVFLIVIVLFKENLQYIWLVPISVFLAILMFMRFKRFTIIRYVRILRTYLYKKDMV